MVIECPIYYCFGSGKDKFLNLLYRSLNTQSAISRSISSELFALFVSYDF